MKTSLTERQSIILGMMLNYASSNLDDLNESFLDPTAKTIEDLSYNGQSVMDIGPKEIEVLLRKFKQI